MKTLLLRKQHEKCIAYLELIDRAEARRNTAVERLLRKQMTTFQNELKLWPCGAPPEYQLQQEVNTSQALLARLENSYTRYFNKIQHYANEPTTH